MAGASLKVRVRRIEIHQYQAATAAAIMITQLYRLTTAGTGGTVITTQPLDTTDPAAGATAMTLPTVKGTEATNPTAWAGPIMWQTIGASSSFPTPAVVWDFDRPRTKPLILQAGATIGIAIKNVTAIAAGGVVIMVWLDESNF
jgi:hypothetical protein